MIKLLSLKLITTLDTFCRTWECNALICHSFLEGTVVWRVQILDSRRLWKKIRTQINSWPLLPDVKIWFGNTKRFSVSFVHTQSDSNNPLFHWGNVLYKQSQLQEEYLGSKQYKWGFQILLELVLSKTHCICFEGTDGVSAKSEKYYLKLVFLIPHISATSILCSCISF